MATDFYSVLGVQPTATDEEIRTAYRKLAVQYHPDKTNGDKAAEEKLKVINEAYEALKTKNRAKTDSKAKAGAGSPYHDNYDPYDDPYHHYTQQWANPHSRNRDTAYDDIFQNIYNRKRNHDIDVNVSVLLEDVFLGNTKHVTYKVSGGTSSINVRIPIGTEDGTKLKFVGMGNHEVKNAAAGDLYVVIRVLPDPQFVRVGKMHLETLIKINPFEAMLGASKEIPIIDGTTVVMKIPPNTNIGQKFKLTGKGMRDAEGNRGNLVVQTISDPEFNLQPQEINDIMVVYEKIQNRRKNG